MDFITYISDSLAKGTVGSYISVGVFGLIAVLALFGAYFGIMRGFSKSVIRFFTVGISAFGALFGTLAISNIIVNLTNVSDAGSLGELAEHYSPGALDSAPEALGALLSEMNSQTAVIFIMMIVCLLVTPILFISLFYLLKGITFIVYKLLAGLTGAISYDKGVVSAILGGVVGLVQGVAIAAVIVIPISGLVGVAENARGPLVDDASEPNEAIVSFYDTVIDDLADNPFFETVDKLGGATAYRKMVTVTINGEKLDMAKESSGAIKLVADAIPLANPDFHWADPSEEEKQAFSNIVTDIGGNELLASFVSDIMRGLAYAVDSGALELPFEGTNKVLMNDVMSVFKTSTKDNVEGDLDMIVDIYYIMCDRGILVSFDDGNADVLRELLTEKNENGDTVIDEILDRLNQNERGKPIVHSFTKISLSLMHESMGLHGDSAQLYEEVKDDLHTVLDHNRADFETEEEYKAAVKDDLDKALAENDLSIGEDVKQSMVDYIAENYGDKEEITDDDINDAILSYYNSYASNKEAADTEGEGGAE